MISSLCRVALCFCLTFVQVVAVYGQAPLCTHLLAQPKTNLQFEVIPMIPGYRSESAVRYDENSRRLFQVFVRDGLLYDSFGTLLNTNSRYSFVMSKEGEIFALQYHLPGVKEGKHYHSSLLDGQPVAMAGEIQVVAGQVTVVTNGSGHYNPPFKFVGQFIRRLEELGANLDLLDVRRYHVAKNPRPRKEWDNITPEELSNIRKEFLSRVLADLPLEMTATDIAAVKEAIKSQDKNLISQAFRGLQRTNLNSDFIYQIITQSLKDPTQIEFPYALTLFRDACKTQASKYFDIFQALWNKSGLNSEIRSALLEIFLAAGPEPRFAQLFYDQIPNLQNASTHDLWTVHNILDRYKNDSALKDQAIRILAEVKNVISERSRMGDPEAQRIFKSHFINF